MIVRFANERPGRGSRAGRVGTRTRTLALFTVALLAPAATLQAHTAPRVEAIVDENESGVLALRLNQGLARRAGDQWRFVCPSLYRGLGQDVAGALPGGGVAIASSAGVWLMKRDGTIAPHPDPAAAEGSVKGFARSPGALFAMRAHQDLFEVIEVDADKVRVLWTDSRFWNDIAVGTSFLQLVRFEQDEVEELHLSLQGEVLSQQRAPLVDALDVSARAIGDVAYSAATFVGTKVELGRIEQGAWRVLQTVSGHLAGPVETADGTRFIALEGKLAAFDAEVVTPRADTDFIVKLSRLVDRSYASTVTGVRALSSAGLGETLFDLAQLQPPDPCTVPEAQRSACNLEWQHFRFEVLAVNIPLVTSAPGSMACSSAATPSPTAGATVLGTAGAPAPSTTTVTAVPPQTGSRAQCGISNPRPGTSLAPRGATVFALAWLLLRRAARRKRTMPSNVPG